jgi:hypothetical protein
MELQKQFSFVGMLRKKHEEDNNPIQIVTTIIFCNKNGSIFIEINSETNKRINHKRFFEHGPVYKLKNHPDITEDLLSDPFFVFQLSKLKKELVQPPYEGDYLIEGKSNEGWVISANVADANFTFSSSNKDSVESSEENQAYLIRLGDFRVDYNPETSQGKLSEIKYGLSNLELFCDFSEFPLESKYKLSLISTISKGNHDSEILSTEMTLKCIECIDEENLLITYSAWLKLMIS